MRKRPNPRSARAAGRQRTIGTVAALAIAATSSSLVAARAGTEAALTRQSLDARFEVGEPFPNLILPALDDGSPTSIAAFRGQKILLHVFASW